MTTATSLIISTLLLGLAMSRNDKVKLIEIDALTFVSGKETTARRGRPMPQLSCVRGPCSDATLLPVAVQCRNAGTDGVDVQWRCDAELDKSVKFGELQVSCEGYANPDDPFVLKGSCGLEYELVRVGFGRSPLTSTENADGSGLSLFSIVVLLVIGFCLWRCLCARKPAPQDAILPPETFQAPRYRVHSPDDLPPPSYQHATAADSTGLPSMMSHAAAGAAGFALGRATAPKPTPTFVSTSTTTTTTTNSSATDRDHSESRQATGFATTKRR